MKINYFRAITRVESLLGVFLALLIPVAEADGSAFVEIMVSILR